MAKSVSLEINILEQTLDVLDRNGCNINRYLISTAANGPGQQINSGCTPTGNHIVRAKIGNGQPTNSIFIGRRPTGEIYQPGMRDKFPQRDWILTRIIWLSGCESGFNRSGDVDTMRRYIYIHGTPEEVELGKPGSAGCIRMRNLDLLTLFNCVCAGTPVKINA
jgi:L,D-transpeptidase YbiS